MVAFWRAIRSSDSDRDRGWRDLLVAAATNWKRWQLSKNFTSFPMCVDTPCGR